MGELSKFEGIGGASQNGGEFLATSGELRWDAQPATLDNPKSGMHPALGGASQIIGEICLTIGGFDQVDGFGLT